MMTTNTPYHTLMSARVVQHRCKGKDFGLWARLQRITDVVPKSILTPASRKVPIGVVSNRRILIVLRAPRGCRIASQLAEAMPSWPPAPDGTPKPDVFGVGLVPQAIQWAGMGRLRAEPEYAARVYLPKRVAAILDRSNLGRACTAHVWHLPPDWIIVDLTF